MKLVWPLLDFLSLGAVVQSAVPLTAMNLPVATGVTPSVVSVALPREEERSYASSFYMAMSIIVVSEIGDKTFLIAALMSMRHAKWVVFSAAFLALAVMTVLLGVVGHALPGFVSERVTHFLAAVLFVVFGANLLREGLAMSKEAGVGEEMADVEEELQASTLNTRLDSIEAGSSKSPGLNGTLAQIVASYRDTALVVLSPVWIQVFVMTFLGEWGDRSQIATIAMGAGSDYWTVIFGAVVGHTCCTAAATVGGQLLATKISMRNVTLCGAVAFFIFSIVYFYEFYVVDGMAV